jgi:hypothetical protein
MKKKIQRGIEAQSICTNDTMIAFKTLLQTVESAVESEKKVENKMKMNDESKMDEETAMTTLKEGSVENEIVLDRPVVDLSRSSTLFRVLYKPLVKTKAKVKSDLGEKEQATKPTRATKPTKATKPMPMISFKQNLDDDIRYIFNLRNETVKVFKFE